MNIQKIIANSKNHILFFTIIFLILFFGLILIYFGYNESFYSDNDIVKNIFKVITLLGSAEFFIVVFSVFYYSINKDLGKNLLYIFLFSAYVNIFLKSFIKDPRPSSNIIDGNKTELGFGFPSAHAQLSVSFWGYIFYSFKDSLRKYYIQIFSIFLIFIISISRLILGVHDLVEVIGGIITGLIVLEIFILIKPKISGFAEVPLYIKLPFFGLFAFSLWYSSAYLFPGSFKEFGMLGGIFFSALVFIPLEEKFVGYTTDFFDLKKKIVIAIFSVSLISFGFFLIDFILSKIVLEDYIFVYIEYLSLGFFIFLFLPLLLKRAINHFY